MKNQSSVILSEWVPRGTLLVMVPYAIFGDLETVSVVMHKDDRPNLPCSDAELLAWARHERAKGDVRALERLYALRDPQFVSRGTTEPPT